MDIPGIGWLNFPELFIGNQLNVIAAGARTVELAERVEVKHEVKPGLHTLRGYVRVKGDGGGERLTLYPQLPVFHRRR